MTMETRSLAARFRADANSLNFLRLVLASLVIVSHSWPLSGREPEPALGGANLGTWAVFGFFTISGFLITRSRLSGAPARKYYRARALRILPAFVVALAVVAFVFAPLSLLFDPAGAWNPLSSVTYVARNLPLYAPILWQPGIVDTLSTAPFAPIWNGPLWTLFWEAACYVLIGVLVSIVPRRALVPVLAAGFGALTLVALVDGLGVVALPAVGGGALELDRVIPLFLAFLGGALMFLLADRIRLGLVPAAIALAALVVTVVLGQVPALGTLLFGFLLLALGIVLPLRRVGSRFDISYGVYIYGWPVQQLLILAVGPELPLPLYILLVFVGTIPLAFLSCVLVEKPALRLKGRMPAATIAAPTP